MERFEVIEHTADIGIRAFGATCSELFENAAAGMFSLITDLQRVSPRDGFELSLTAADREELLVEWLNELLYIYDSNAVLLSRFEIRSLEKNRLEARVSGEAIDPARHPLDMDIKAVTYHMLRVAKTAAGWSAEIIFDV